jgi:hypothetical protein
MKALLKRIANALGYQIGPANRWSNTVEGYYPVFPRPRWGHGTPSNPHIRQALQKRRSEYKETLRSLAAHNYLLQKIQVPYDPTHAQTPYWDNEWFQSFDAACLVCFLAQRNPTYYVEIGSGHSTAFAHHAINEAGLKTKITSVDPQPRSGIDSLCDKVIRCTLEDSDLSIFDNLEQGDIVFFDGSHRVFQNSDVTIFFLEVLPRLTPGVLVHIHDIFLPDDYPSSWANRLFSEQYLLGAMLLCQETPFKVVIPNYFVSTDEDFTNDILRIFGRPEGGVMPGAYYRGAKKVLGSSFWVETL